MGCDIHIGIQVFEDDAWRHITWQRRPYEQLGEVGTFDGYPVAPEAFDRRNYSLFGILADVRNAVGFAGVQTGDAWPSIAPGRGFPDDVEPGDVPCDPRHGTPLTVDVEPARSVARRLLGTVEARYMGDHSYTWISLEELETFDWDGTVRRQTGVVDASTFETLQPGERPSSYSGGVFGPRAETYLPDQYRAARAAGTLAPKPYVAVEWNESARDDWPGEVLPWLPPDGRSGSCSGSTVRRW